MKKILIKMAAASLLTIGFCGTASAIQTLRMTVAVPMRHILGQNILEFKKIIEERSKGELKLEIYDSAQLFKGAEVPQAVSSGSIDMGLVELGAYTGTIPAAGVFSVPFIFPTEQSIKEATSANNPVRQALDKAILDTGARVLWWQAYGAVHMLSKDKPIRSPEDLKGKKVRVISKSIGSFIKDQGGAPVVIDGAEQFMAYQRGTVDIGMSGTTAVQSRRMYEVMNYLTLTNHADIEFLVIMNEKIFGKLKPEYKKILVDAALIVETSLREDTVRLNQEARDYLSTKTKMKIVDLTAAEIEAWRKSAQPNIERFAKENGPLAQQIVDATRSKK